VRFRWASSERCSPFASSFFVQFATGAGGFAAMIAVGAFIGQVGSAIREEPDTTLRRSAVIGGLIGMGIGLVILLSAIPW
jgi:hypothetical protein